MSFSSLSVGFVVRRCHFVSISWVSEPLCSPPWQHLLSYSGEYQYLNGKTCIDTVIFSEFYFRFCLSQLMCIYDDNYRLLIITEELQNLHCMKYFFSPLYVPHVKSFHPPTYYMQMDPTVYPPGTQPCFKVVVSRFCTKQIRYILYLIFRITHERITSQYWSDFAVLFISRCRFTGKFCQD